MLYRPRKASASVVLVLFILMIITVLVLVIFSPTEYRRQILNESGSSGSNYYTDTMIFQANNVLINESNERTHTEYVSLQDTNLDRASFKADYQISNEFTLENNFIKDTAAKFVLSSDSGLESAYFTFFVVSKEGQGKIKVFLNSEQIDLIYAEPGQKVTVNIPKSKIVSGENEIAIKVTYPVLPWMKNIYNIADLRAHLTEKSSNILSDQSFVIEEEGIEDPLIYAYITKLAHSEDDKKIRIILNDNLIFDGVPSIVNDNRNPSVFRLPIEVSDLKEKGVNYISWEVEDGGAYSIDFSRLEYEKRTVDEEETVFRFNVNENNYKKVRSTQYSCILEFESPDYNEVFEFYVNSDFYSGAINEQDISFDVCDSLVEGLNTLKIYSKEDIIFSNIKLEVIR